MFEHRQYLSYSRPSIRCLRSATERETTRIGVVDGNAVKVRVAREQEYEQFAEGIDVCSRMRLGAFELLWRCITIGSCLLERCTRRGIASTLRDAKVSQLPYAL